MKVDSLKSLLHHELQDLYSGETQQMEILPEMVRAAQSTELKQALVEHLDLTKVHAGRIHTLAEEQGVKTDGHICHGVEGIIREAREVIESAQDQDVRDAAIIGMAQRAEHYEIAGYGTARAYAEQLGEGSAAEVLTETLIEERETDEKLTKLAEASINKQAIE